MAISSVNKNFMLDGERAVESFSKIVANPSKSVRINRLLTSPRREKQGEEKLKRMFSGPTN